MFSLGFLSEAFLNDWEEGFFMVYSPLLIYLCQTSNLFRIPALDEPVVKEIVAGNIV